MNLRFYADTLKKANRELTKAITRAQAVEVENRRLRHDLNQARRQAGRGARLWILRRARADALTLILWGLAGDNVSRRAAIERGFSQRRWQWARALLAFSGVVVGGELQVESVGEGSSRLAEAVHFFEGSDPRLDNLVALLPKGAVPVTFGTVKAEPSQRKRGKGETFLAGLP